MGIEILQNGLLKYLPEPIGFILAFYFICKIIDFATGILKTLKNKYLYKSGKMRDGIIRWIAEMVAIVFVIGIDLVLGLNFYLCGFTLSLFIYKEAGSIAENLTECGVELPSIVTEKLEVFNKQTKEQE